MSLLHKLYINVTTNLTNQVSLQSLIPSDPAQIKWNPLIRRNKKSCLIEASSFATNIRGSMTVEAALSGTLFFFVVISIISIIQILLVYDTVRQALVDTGRYVSVACYEEKEMNDRFLIYTSFYDHYSQYENQGIQTGLDLGFDQISLLGSQIEKDTGNLVLKASYFLKPTLLYVPGIKVPVNQSLVMKPWTGYKRTSGETGSLQQNKTYYVAENAGVYHLSAQCSHLLLSISMTDKEAAQTGNNIHRQVYTPCEHCHSSYVHASVYITENGNRYHSSLQCQGLKRTVSQVTDTGQLSICSRCGG